MDFSPAQDIIRLATDAAHEVVGADAKVRVDVEAGTDSSDKPAYFFFYRIRKDFMPDLSPGLIRIRLIQHIVDKLIAVGDTHEPIIRTMTLSGWETPSGA
jgi:hypothetical protein